MEDNTNEVVFYNFMENNSSFENLREKNQTLREF